MALSLYHQNRTDFFLVITPAPLCIDLHVGACSIPIGRPVRHWSVTLGDTNATRRTNFRIRLLTGCDGLEQDASHFRYRTHGRSSGDPTCKLCGLGPENAEHFISNCHSLDAARVRALQSAPPQVRPHLPNPARDPVGFSDVILGIDWIDHRPTQLFITEFLSQLKAARTAILQSRP